MFHLPLSSAEEGVEFARAVGGDGGGGCGGSVTPAFSPKASSAGSWLFAEDDSRGLVHVKQGCCKLFYFSSQREGRPIIVEWPATATICSCSSQPHHRD